MGSTVSAGVDNNDLVDNLLEADYIKTPHVERVFRAVDRGMYFTESGRENAYKDFAWKSGNIHLSAPCIYCEVMENLNLGPGMSFLNLGSGTGYLSTMAGLMLGSYGVNHGVEIHHDVVLYALKKLEEFKKTASAIDEFDFCEPKFVEGNCLQLDSCSMKYDRVYCGAACPPSFEHYMKNLLKVDGVLVLPLNDKLLRITRTSETSWDAKSLLPVAFANLLEPLSSPLVVLPVAEPISLMGACRTTIRGILQAVVKEENPELRAQSPPKSKKQRTLRRLYIPMFGESESMTIIRGLEHEQVVEGDSDDTSMTPSRGEASNSDENSPDRPVAEDASRSPLPGVSEDEQSPRLPRLRRRARSSSEDSDDPSDSSSSLTSIYQVQRALFHAISSFDIGHRNFVEQERGPASEFADGRVMLDVSEVTHDVASSDSSVALEDSSDSSMDVDQLGPQKSELSSSKSKWKVTDGIAPKRPRNKRKESEMEESDQSSSLGRRSSQKSCTSTNEADEKSRGDQQAHSSKKKREKVDSGIGEEINNWDISPSDMGSELDPASDSDEDRHARHKEMKQQKLPHGLLLRRNGNRGNQKDRKGGPSVEARKHPASVLNSVYVLGMRSRIQQLPLPPSIKMYINYHRDL